MWSRVFDRRTNGVIGWHIKCQMLTLFCLPDILPVDTNLFLHFYSHFFLTNCDYSGLLAAYGCAPILLRVADCGACGATIRHSLKNSCALPQAVRSLEELRLP